MRQKWLVYGGTSQSVDSCGLWIKPWKPSFKPTCGQFKEYQFSVASFSFSFDHTKISDLINFFFFYQNRIKVASIQIKWMEVWKKCCHNTGGSSLWTKLGEEEEEEEDSTLTQECLTEFTVWFLLSECWGHNLKHIAGLWSINKTC